MQVTKKRGRPPKDLSEARACTLNLNVTFLMKSKIKDLARRDSLTVSDYLLKAVTKYIEEVENV